MTKLLAIDPGSTDSAYVVIDTDKDLAPLWFDKIPNEGLLHLPHLHTADQVAIEMVAHYGSGMPAGKTVFDTCVWIGRYVQARAWHPNNAVLIPRKTVVTHLCGSPKGGDSNVIQALIDRFAPNTRNHGKGIKNEPGFFWGFHTDIWQSFALAVYYVDTHIKAVA